MSMIPLCDDDEMMWLWYCEVDIQLNPGSASLTAVLGQTGRWISNEYMEALDWQDK